MSSHDVRSIQYLSNIQNTNWAPWWQNHCSAVVNGLWWYTQCAAASLSKTIARISAGVRSPLLQPEWGGGNGRNRMGKGRNRRVSGKESRLGVRTGEGGVDSCSTGLHQDHIPPPLSKPIWAAEAWTNIHWCSCIDGGGLVMTGLSLVF